MKILVKIKIKNNVFIPSNKKIKNRIQEAKEFASVD